MSYLEAFRDRIKHEDYPGFLKIWEEYCFSDQPDAEELIAVLKEAKESSLVKAFGKHVQRALSLWEQLKEPEKKDEILKLIADIQNTNDEDLADIFTKYLKDKYGNDKHFEEKMRLIGLRSRENFQGAISGFELLNHIQKGNFVFHTAGWGTGEIIDFSTIREEITLEFDFVVGYKYLSYENGLKTLLPLSKDHFLSRRFGNADDLEKQAKADPLSVIHMLLKDLGPKTASEVKEELYDLVIPASDWNKWWQMARTKMKKDPFIEHPSDLKKPFILRKEAVSHEETLKKAFENKPTPDEIIQLIYSFLKNYPETLKKEDFRLSLKARLEDVLSIKDLPTHQKVQIAFFLEDIGEETNLSEEIIKDAPEIENLVNSIEILSIKKRVLTLIKKTREDADTLFLNFLKTLDPALLKDYLFSELLKSSKAALLKLLQDLVNSPASYPETYFWYFKKIVENRGELPFSDKKGLTLFFEGLLVLLDAIQYKVEFIDLAKKIVSIITEDRFKIVRDILEMATLEQVKELVLLSTKCKILEDHDIKIIQALAEVVYPSLKEKENREENEIIWTTEEGYKKAEQTLRRIGTQEIVQNAREIEEARSHGDLRENAEYKAALEKRDRLQSELKALSTLFDKARILTKQDVTTHSAGIGTVIECVDKKNKKEKFIILGPWEADPEKNILSFNSKLAIAMQGKMIGEKFQFKENEYTIKTIKNFFDN